MELVFFILFVAFLGYVALNVVGALIDWYQPLDPKVTKENETPLN